MRVGQIGLTGYKNSRTVRPTVAVVAPPPRSGVRGLGRSKSCRTAFRIRSAARGWFKWSSIIATDRIAAKGLAIPFPAMSGAEPCTGSNMLGAVGPG